MLVSVEASEVYVNRIKELLEGETEARPALLVAIVDIMIEEMYQSILVADYSHDLNFLIEKLYRPYITELVIKELNALKA